MKELCKILLSVALALAVVALIGVSVADTGQETAVPLYAACSAKPMRKAAQTARPLLEESLAQNLPEASAPQAQEPAAGEKSDADDTAASADNTAQTPAQAVASAPAAAAAVPASSTSVLWVGLTDGEVNLRSGAGTTHSVLATLPSATAVSVLNNSGGWAQVRYDGKTGYMSAAYLTMQSASDSLNCYGWVNADGLNVRSAPSVSSDKVFTLSRGVYVSVTGFHDGWFAVRSDSGSGYVSGDYLMLCRALPVATQNTAPASSTTSQNTTSHADANEIVAYARTFLDVPYVYGGASPAGFDCSGFTMYVMAHFGISLPHGSNGQFAMGRAVGYSELQSGDLVFFFNAANGSGPTTHVGIYIGGGQFIHASSYYIYNRVVITDMSSGSYYRDFVGGRRIG